MTTTESESGATREDLLQRIEMMETMIAAGRRSTTRKAWIFVLWGLVNVVAVSWRHIQPHSFWVGNWDWPICLSAGVVLTFAGRALQKTDHGLRKSIQGRNVEAVWGMMGVALAIFIASAMVRHLTWEYSYLAGLLIIIGLAHAISAVILRSRAQGLVAGIWWAGAIAMFFSRGPSDVNAIMIAEMCVGMILFGLYAMMLERRNNCGPVKQLG
jgi:hypothetical protein